MSGVSRFTPEDGSKLNGVTFITGTAFHTNTSRIVTRVQIRIEPGDWTTADGTNSWKYKLDTTKLEDGSHSIEVNAFDGERYSVPMGINITTSNPISTDNNGLMALLAASGIAGIIACAVGIYLISKKKTQKRHDQPISNAIKTERAQQKAPVAI